MPDLPPTFAAEVIELPAQAQFEAFLDEHRSALRSRLDGLTEEQTRRSLVPSATTLLGLVKHGIFLEKVWFDEAVTGRSRAEIGIPETSPESFLLQHDDTIASVRQAHREACAASRRATSLLDLDDTLHGYRRGPVPLRWVYLHALRELAQHCGHADILRERGSRRRPPLAADGQDRDVAVELIHAGGARVGDVERAVAQGQVGGAADPAVPGDPERGSRLARGQAHRPDSPVPPGRGVQVRPSGLMTMLATDLYLVSMRTPATPEPTLTGTMPRGPAT